MLNATWIETFTTLCETGHFTQAAARLHMTQPGVSQHLQKLEAQVGRPLIAREGKSFTLTEAGEAVFALGLSRRAEEEMLRQTVETDDRDSGDVRIACSGSFAMILSPHLLPWMKTAPDLAVHVEAAPQAAVLAGLIEGRFDLGVLDANPGHPRLEARLLGQEELCLVLPGDASSLVPTFDDLEARGFIAHPDGAAYADDLLHVNFPETYPGADRLHVRAYVNQINQIPAPVSQGIGYTLLPRSGIDAFGRSDLLTVVPLPERRWHELWLVSRGGRQMPARISHAADLIGCAAAGLG